jgi:FMN phosphatase YigB (HAD superfamily)
MRKIAYVFDVDETLIRCDPKYDKAHNFMKFKPVDELPNMMRLFKGLLDIKRPVWILTNRHPDVREQIAKFFKFNIEDIICRDYCLTDNEMEMISSDPSMEEIFLKRMIIEKIHFLNGLAEEYDRVCFYDDHAADYIKNKDLSKKVWVIMPW